MGGMILVLGAWGGVTVSLSCGGLESGGLHGCGWAVWVVGAIISRDTTPFGVVTYSLGCSVVRWCNMSCRV